MRAPELLAPAGSLESLLAGVNSGADAVYFGYGEFNARRNAKNFTKEDFREAATYCKARGVKIHLTMNTLVYDREHDGLMEILELACENGVDAVIVQDIGAAKWIHEAAPNMTLHASTQMTIHNVSGAKMLLEAGFSRAVLAREMTKEEIREIISQVPIEVEVFVHGALCMSVSGQCYMSSIIGERSGNRGLCAQPCRLPFSSGRGDEGYALSLKDLTLVNRVSELVDLGVNSFKIEGRMKRPEYVASAVKGFREVLNGGQPNLEELQAAFSRNGFTQGYFDDKRGTHMFGIRQKEDIISGQKLFKGLRDESSKEFSRVNIDFEFLLHANEPVKLTVWDKENNRVCLEGGIPEIANNRPTDQTLIERSLEKIGGTFYKIGEINCDIEDGLICPVSQINKLRREALEKLTEIRSEIKPIAFQNNPQTKPSTHVQLQKTALRAQVRSLHQVTPLLEESCECIYIPLDEFCKRKSDISDSLLNKLIVSLPRLTFGDDQKQLSSQLDEIKNCGINHVSTGNLGGLGLARKLGFIVHGEFGLNIANTASIEEYERLGLADCVVSYELSLPRARDLGGDLSRGFIAYGHLPLMVTRNCPINQSGCKNCNQNGKLSDRRGESFPVYCTAHNYSEILNGKALYLAERMDEFRGFDFGLLYFTPESPSEVNDIIYQYTEGFSKKDDITRGLYYRNVK